MGGDGVGCEWEVLGAKEGAWIRMEWRTYLTLRVKDEILMLSLFSRCFSNSSIYIVVI